MGRAEDCAVSAATSAEARRIGAWVGGTALEDGGLRETLLASGVLFRLLIAKLLDMLSII